MDDLIFVADFVRNSLVLFENLQTNTEWDERMKARLTASFGAAYNYSQIFYPDKPMPEKIEILCGKIYDQLGFKPNSCLINFYPDGDSTMGFHSDQVDILTENTGVAIVSLGDTRFLRFRKIENHDEIFDYELPSGSLIYMPQEVQRIFQHSIPKSNSAKGRMSLTFRKIK